jgi:hypothetical protein
MAIAVSRQTLTFLSSTVAVTMDVLAFASAMVAALSLSSLC